jgi:uncharacterized protein
MIPTKSSAVQKFMTFPLVRLIIGAFMVIASVNLVQLAFSALHMSKDSPLRIVEAILACVVAITAYNLFVRYVERRAVHELASAGAFKEWSSGVLIGATMFALTIGVIALMGHYQIVGRNPWSILLAFIPMVLTSGVVEEILLRGVFFRIMEDWTGSWLAIALSAALFGALHLGNSNATAVAGAAIAIEAGVMLAAAYMVTRRLWLAIGIHMAWNFTQGAIFGVAVSGNESKGLLVSKLTGSDLISGGKFGVEASIFAVIFGIILSIVLLRIASQRGQFRQPNWKSWQQ